MFLQSTVVPIVIYATEFGSANVKETAGTAFFFNRSGYFLTAKHVLDYAHQKSLKTQTQVGVAVKADNGTSKEYMIAPLIESENAPDPYDISVGSVRYRLDSLDKTLQPIDVEVWQRVATYGYPLGGCPRISLATLAQYADRINQ